MKRDFLEPKTIIDDIFTRISFKSMDFFFYFLLFNAKTLENKRIESNIEMFLSTCNPYF